REAEQPHLPHLLHHVERELLPPVHLLGPGSDDLFRKLPNGLAELLLLGREIEVHRGQGSGADGERRGSAPRRPTIRVEELGSHGGRGRVSAKSQTLDPLSAGREAIQRHAWQEAFDHLWKADAQRALGAQDLESLAEAAWWI